jgi:hypothetical protein
MVRFQLVSCLVGMMLTAQIAICAAGQRSLKAELEYSFATNVGLLVGAATACPNIDRARIRNVNDRFTDFFSSSTSGNDIHEVKQLYNNSIAEGQRAVLRTSADCVKADHDLAEWESIIKAVWVAPTSSVPTRPTTRDVSTLSVTTPTALNATVDGGTTPAPLATAPFVATLSPTVPLFPENGNRGISLKADDVRSYVRQDLMVSPPPTQVIKPAIVMLSHLAVASRFGTKYVVRIKHNPLHRRRRRLE